MTEEKQYLLTVIGNELVTVKQRGSLHLGGCE